MTDGPAGVRIDDAAVSWSRPADERGGRPLLLVLHGHGMDESIGAGVRHRLPAGLVVASLRAPLRSGGGYGWFPLDSSLTVAQVDDSAAAVWRWLAGWSAEHADTPPTSVGVLGFSQGAGTAFQLLREHPDQITYAVNLSGFVVPLPSAGDAALARRRPPVFWGRGDRDAVIPAFLVQSTRRWLSDHTTLTERAYPGLGHDVTDAEIEDLAAFLRDRLR